MEDWSNEVLCNLKLQPANSKVSGISVLGFRFQVSGRLNTKAET